MIRRRMLSLFLGIVWISSAGAVLAGEEASAAPQAADAPVTVAEDQSSLSLANGLISVRISKPSGNLVSWKYRDLELIGPGRGYWSFVGGSFFFGRASAFGSQREFSVSIDPKTNDGARGEVSCNFNYVKAKDGLPADVQWRYSLGRGEHWLYAYAIWRHPAAYPAFSLGEARYAIKLNPDVFDYMTIDAHRCRVMPTGGDWDQGTELNMSEVRRMNTGVHKGEVEHKYSYSAVLADTPAYGWSSTKYHVGFWLINPSFEYIAGGPTKVELTAHLDCNPGGLPTLLNMWLGSHYGGSAFSIAKDEQWTKVIGPFLLYCNSAPDHEAMWKDALQCAPMETDKWPYPWVSDPAYPLASGRATAQGRILIDDPLDQNLHPRNIQVGLTAPDYSTGSSRRWAAWPDKVDWQRDAKYYQFWTRAQADGRFTIPHVRPGTYTLHAIADGVLGEFTLEDVKVDAGQTLDLGSLRWTPKRYGRTVWEIGVPDRTAAEFRHGDHYWQWGLYYKYPQEFPHDVNFVIGKSDWRKDWNYCQPPRIEDNHVSGTTWSVTFDLPEKPGGQATLRLGICGSGGNNIAVSVNDKPIGETGRLPSTGAMHWNGIRSYWCERDLPFDAALLTQGANVIKLKSPTFHWNQGVLYDYLRLEMNAEKNSSNTQ
jgi:rhamnogalacturonan endolyase